MNNTDFISPKHYQDTRLMDLLINKQVPFAEGNIMKYVYRWKEKDGLKDLFQDGFDIERFILGTFADANDVFKRPLTKMKQDIMNQLRK